MHFIILAFPENVKIDEIYLRKNQKKIPSQFIQISGARRPAQERGPATYICRYIVVGCVIFKLIHEQDDTSYYRVDHL